MSGEKNTSHKTVSTKFLVLEFSGANIQASVKAINSFLLHFFF
jgi:hypothetical protein